MGAQMSAMSVNAQNPSTAPSTTPGNSLPFQATPSLQAIVPPPNLVSLIIIPSSR